MTSLSDYNPYGIEMYDHQRETQRFILANKRCFVFDSIGTGKTISALSACDFLMLHGKIKRVLIIAPLSVCRATWCDHIIDYFPHRKFAFLHGPKKKRLQLLDSLAEFFIINTDGIKIIEKELIRRKFDIMIIDESTTFSSQSARTKVAWRLSKAIPSVVAMTGNPIPNDTLQSYAQAKLINFDRPKYFTKYRDQLKIKFDMYTYVDRPEAVAISHAVMQPSIRHDLTECLDIPEIVFKIAEIPMTKDQKDLYNEMAKEYITWLKSGEKIIAPNAAVKGLKLLQISAGLAIDESGEAIEVNHKPRMDELKLIQGQTRKLIVFAVFTRSVNEIVAAFPGAKKIDGSVSSNDRYDIIRDFQEGDLDILVCQPAAISHGVTLTASNTIVWWSPPYSNEQFEQCNGRIRRVGQKRPQLVIQFKGSKVEKKVIESLLKKQNVSDSFLNFDSDIIER